jgi:hypothetical protein
MTGLQKLIIIFLLSLVFLLVGGNVLPNFMSQTASAIVLFVTGSITLYFVSKYWK